VVPASVAAVAAAAGDLPERLALFECAQGEEELEGGAELVLALDGAVEHGRQAVVGVGGVLAQVVGVEGGGAGHREDAARRGLYDDGRACERSERPLGGALHVHVNGQKEVRAGHGGRLMEDLLGVAGGIDLEELLAAGGPQFHVEGPLDASAADGVGGQEALGLIALVVVLPALVLRGGDGLCVAEDVGGEALVGVAALGGGEDAGAGIPVLVRLDLGRGPEADVAGHHHGVALPPPAARREGEALEVGLQHLLRRRARDDRQAVHQVRRRLGHGDARLAVLLALHQARAPAAQEEHRHREVHHIAAAPCRVTDLDRQVAHRQDPLPPPELVELVDGTPQLPPLGQAGRHEGDVPRRGVEGQQLAPCGQDPAAARLRQLPAHPHVRRVVPIAGALHHLEVEQAGRDHQEPTEHENQDDAEAVLIHRSLAQLAEGPLSRARGGWMEEWMGGWYSMLDAR